MKLQYTIIFIFFWLSLSAQNTNQYIYDVQSRLTQTSYFNGVTYAYTYDKLGNRISKTIVGKSLEVSATQLAISAAANSTANFTITSNQNWSISSNQSWLSPNVISGSNNSTITLTATQNSDTNSREATITVSAIGITPLTIVVSQSGTEEILAVTPSGLSLASAAGSNNVITIASTTNWAIISSEIWLTISASSGNGNQEIVVTATSVNAGVNARSAMLTFSADGIASKVVTIFQQGSISGSNQNSMTYVPDDNFEQALIDLGYDTGELNDSVPTQNINSLTYLTLSSEHIADLTGIEAFTALDTLLCSYNDLVTLDLSNNTELKYLGCRSNELTSLNISNNTKLTYCYCGDNAITELDLTNLSVLWGLNCSDNLLSNLNLSNNSLLEQLYCTGNQLSSVDVSENIKLTKLNCRDNQIVSLELSNNPNLIYLGCYNNQLTSLNIKNGNNSILEDMDCTNNPNLNCIEVDNPTLASGKTDWEKDAVAVYSIDCNTAMLPTMTYVPDDIFEQWLIDRHYDSGELNDSVPTQNINTMVSLTINGENISDLTGIEGFQSLEILNCTSNQLRNLDLSNNKSLKKLYCVDNQIESLNVSANDSLIELWCYSNPLANLNVSNNVSLQKLYCENTRITELDVSRNIQLTTVDCQDNNQLTRLNLKNGNNSNIVVIRANDNPTLTCVTVDDPTYSQTNWGGNFDKGVEFSLNCNGSDIVYIPDANFKAALVGNSAINTNGDNEIQVSEAEAITGTIDVGEKNISDLTGIEAFINVFKLYCYNNNIANIDLSHNLNLNTLICSFSQVSNLLVSSNSNLQYLSCQGNNLSELDVSSNLKLISLDMESNHIAEIDLSGNVELQSLYCNNNELINLDLTHNLKLTTLYCESTEVSSLDLSNNINLESLFCHNNLFYNLDLQKNTKLKCLRCSGSQNLVSLNLKNGNNANITHNEQYCFELTNIPNLSCVTVDDPAYSETNWGGNFDVGVEFSLNCNVSDIVYIPDANFKAALVGNLSINSNGDAEIQVSEAEAYTGQIYIVSNWDTPDNEKISDLTGVEAFTLIYKLNCNNNLLTTIDVSKNTALTYLDCGSNNITSLDVSNNTLINELYCQSNELTSLDISTNIALTKFDCGSNLLTNIDVSNNLALKELWCYVNSLASLNIGANLSLTHINCRQNELTELDVASNTLLVYLNCAENSISNLDISNNNSLLDVGCWSNQLTSLDISNNLHIERLKCDYNQIASLDLVSHSAFILLECQSNRLKELDVSNNHNLKALFCQNNSLDYLRLDNGNNSNMETVFFRVWRMVSQANSGSLNITNNPDLSCIQVDDPAFSETNADWKKDEIASYSTNCNANGNAMTYVPDDNFEQALIDLGYDSGELNDSIPTVNINSVTNLNVDGRRITDLTGIEDFVALIELYCSNNQLSTLDFSFNTALIYLYCNNNQLTTLDVSSNTVLNRLNCYNNQLTKLDVSSNTLLKSLWCSDNQLSTLDVGFNTALTWLTCSNNQLSTLDVNSNSAMTYLNCGYNQLFILDVEINTALTYLDCSGNQLSTLDVSSNTALTHLDCRGKLFTAIDVSANTALTYLDFSGNTVTTVDLSSNIALELLLCNSNQLTSLDVSSNTSLTDIDCRRNQLSSLNLRNGNNLNMTDSKWLIGMNATNNPNLTCIQVDDPTASETYTDWEKDDQASYSQNCTQNQVPVANAGQSITLYEGETGMLDASASYDPDGDELSYRWIPMTWELILSNLNAVQPTFTAPEVETDRTFGFYLEVCDGGTCANWHNSYVAVKVLNKTAIAHFTPVWTGNGVDHMNINVYGITIDGLDLEVGDEVGAFDGELCVGSAMITSTVSETNLLNIVVSANDGSGNGYTPGNVITYKVYDQSNDQTRENVSAMYSVSNPSWSSDGLFSIGKTAFVELTSVSQLTQQIELSAGWNIISSYVIPEYIDMMQNIQGLIDNSMLKKVMDEAGRSIENYGIFGGWQNGIGNWNTQKGYKVNVTGTSSVEITGQAIALPVTINLNEGWNIISWPASTDPDAMQLVQQLIDEGKLKKVMNEVGQSIENFGIFGGWQNGIGDFRPGKGYKVNVNGPCQMIVTNDNSKSALILPEIIAAQHFIPVFKGNGFDHMNINLVELKASGIDAGDEIGVFDGDLCVGAATVGSDQMQLDYISIPASCNDGLSTSPHGFTNGHTIKLMLYRYSQEMILDWSVAIDGSAVFKVGESMFAQVTSDIETSNEALIKPVLTINCYPNPFNDVLQIELKCANAQDVNLGIYNVVGQKVKTLFCGKITGNKNFQWDGTDNRSRPLKKGIYFIKNNGMVQKINYMGKDE
ncbi:MAG: BACON domain-containing protein [Prolixibacteraceae bacterium]